MARPYVDQDVCIGCEVCANMVSEVFRMTEDAVAEVHDPEGAPPEKIQEAMDSCPVSCIHWTD
ncbi:MAG TPA: ferredoxin [Desulfuromonadaceae bacterium]|jgi:ferredoxin